MELEPQSEDGKRLLNIIRSLIRQSPKIVVDKLKRMFLTHSLKVKNGDGFVAVLYGQNALEKSPLNQIEQAPTTLLRVQHGIETALDRRRIKGLIVALELSENESFLTEILTWLEKASEEIIDAIKTNSFNLAPRKVRKRVLLSEITTETMTPRHRTINSGDIQEPCTVLEACNDKIIMGYASGEIQIHDSVDLRWQNLPNYTFYHQGIVTCLQCIGPEVIAGYSDGNICVWNVQDRNLAHRLSVLNENYDEEDYAACMRWRDGKLVVGTDNGRVKIWVRVDISTFKLATSWDAMKDGGIRQVEFNDDLHHTEAKSAGIKVNSRKKSGWSAASYHFLPWRIALHGIRREPSDHLVWGQSLENLGHRYRGFCKVAGRS